MNYTDARNIQMLIYLMKMHGIKKVVASPGTTNLTFVASIQQDPFFEIYSSADERSAAYIACGLAAESGEPVALSCTGATASRNYTPGLTEAFYRKLPVLAITSTQHVGRIGNHAAQVIDRTTIMNDIAKISVQIPLVHDAEDEWAYTVMINKALLELTHRGGGPVHINLETNYSRNYTVSELPPVRLLKRVEQKAALPVINAGTVGIFVGAHQVMDASLTDAIDSFCEAYNGAVFCDQTSNYRGKYRILPSLVGKQVQYVAPCRKVDLMIHIGEVSGADMVLNAQDIWRVNPDGEIRDTFKKLSYTFEMMEETFFRQYVALKREKSDMSYYQAWVNEKTHMESLIPELPFGNIWVAQHTAGELPENSVLHLGILNSLRSWNFFETPESVRGYSNTGGFGIDGDLSSLVGASLADKETLYLGVLGDLAFFYDMNVMGNRHVGRNLRVMLINNGKGTEFRNYNHFAAPFGDEADAYIAAAGHYGRQSRDLVRHYAEDLGFEYLSAGNKEEYLAVKERFISPVMGDKPLFIEVFTNSKDESDALQILHNLETSISGTTKKYVKDILGEKGVHTIKKIIGRG